MRARRAFVRIVAALPLAAALSHARAAPAHPDPRWLRVAEDMRREAESWGDESFGAVLVLDNRVVGFGPSRVVVDQDPNAHAERVAIRDAQRRLGRLLLPGAVLYSTSRPCPLCEAAAAAAKVGRMYFGAALLDAGAPRTP
jgi:tRNA(adenine34) deaminase